MENFLNLIGKLVISLGGGAVIIGACSSFLAKLWAEKFMKDYESKSEYKLHSSQIQFEREYSIYNQLWKKLLFMINKTIELNPEIDFLPQDSGEHKDVYWSRYIEFAETTNSFSGLLYSNSPFIDAEIFDELEALLQLCKKQGNSFRQYKIDYPHINMSCKENIEYDERNKKISDETDLLTENSENI